MNRLIDCRFVAAVQRLEDDEVQIRLFQEVEREGLPLFRERIRKKLTLLRPCFDHLIRTGVLTLEDPQMDNYQPSDAPCVVGFDIHSLGRRVSFDLCFHHKLEAFWQESTERIEALMLDPDVFEAYTYRLQAISRYLYLGREDNVFRAITVDENHEIEFKQDFLNSKEKILKSVVAFANTNNGNLYLGVSNDKKIVGIGHEIARYGNEDKYQLAIASLLHNRIYPLLSPFPEMRIVTVGGKKVLHMWVPVGNTMHSVQESLGNGQHRRRVAVKQNNQSVWVDDPYDLAELYIKRRIGTTAAANLGLV
ncbi:AlbA family DNA-binding domain-containing protein [Tumebacillus permanentifrigoris]|uniref:Putative DNA-binding protein n=1 Tax=Tumebacillus permanentifrigoris TaxID=378543 RepID=A0A316D7C6_9BACL|nr:ATP-binding protein [Tumebacillus permanentifrigoris]PWK09695.1 putative DNA-binding protein [Tumebacillus permanentifrigoris]